MLSHLSQVMTLANGVIGVSILAMPFCFKQCGIILAILLLLISSLLSRLACHFLLKSAVMSRRRNFEFLAFHAFGYMGKFMAELFIIGFLVGACITFFVIVGDLGPQIAGKMLNKRSEDIRTGFLVFTAIFIILPLGLLRNIDSLASVCTATIGFYICLVFKVMMESTQHIFAGDWYDRVFYWRPAGILQCLPIFSMALFCQTQLFEIYDAIPNVCLKKMNEVVRGALNICTFVYVCVGFFGYVAFCTQPFTGNILMSFEPSMTSEVIKVGFVFSIAFSFPLVIFPCRASLNSLLFRKVYTHEPSSNYISEMRFRYLTLAIVVVSLITGILMPNIEFVLGMVGSTIGVMICLIFPAASFISISSKNTNERLVAQVILFIGVWIMVLGTYANLYAMEESTVTKQVAMTTSKSINQINNMPLNFDEENIVPNGPDVLKKSEVLQEVKGQLKLLEPKIVVDNLDKKEDIRREPPIPVERVVVTEKSIVATQKTVGDIVVSFPPEIKKIVENKKFDDMLNKESKVDEKINGNLNEEPIILKAEEKIRMIEEKEMKNELQKNDNLINSDAIKKEESELAADEELTKIEAAEQREELRKTLEKHEMAQLEMMQEQKELLKDLKKQKLAFEMKKKERMAKDAVLDKKNKIEQKQDATGLENKDDRQEYLKSNLNKDVGNIGKSVNKEIDLKVHEQVRNLERKEESPDIRKNEQQVKIESNENEINRTKNEVLKTDVGGNHNNEKNLKNKIVFEIGGNDVHGSIVSSVKSVQEMKSSNVSDPTLDKSRGPILSPLVKRTLKKIISMDIFAANSSIQVIEKIEQDEKTKVDVEEGKESLENNDKKKQVQLFVPIALVMNNQTRRSDHLEQPILNESRKDILSIR